MTVLNQDIRTTIHMGISRKLSHELLQSLVREMVPWLKNINGFISACKKNLDHIERVDIESFRYPPVAFEPATTASTETVLENGAVEAHQANETIVTENDVPPITDETVAPRRCRLRKNTIVIESGTESEDELSSVGSQFDNFNETMECNMLKVEPPNVICRVGAKEAKKLLGLPPNKGYLLNYWQRKGWVYAIQPAGSKNFLYSLTQDVFNRAAKRMGRKSNKEKKIAANAPNGTEVVMTEALPAQNNVTPDLPQPSNGEERGDAGPSNGTVMTEVLPAQNNVTPDLPQPSNGEERRDAGPSNGTVMTEALPAQNAVTPDLPQPSNEEKVCIDRLNKAKKVRETFDQEHKAALAEWNNASAELERCRKALFDADAKCTNAADRTYHAHNKAATAVLAINEERLALNALKRKRI